MALVAGGDLVSEIEVIDLIVTFTVSPFLPTISTGATAGTPGTWSPIDSAVPADEAALQNAGTSPVRVDWGDGVAETVQATPEQEISHTYGGPGVYTVTGSASGLLPLTQTVTVIGSLAVSPAEVLSPSVVGTDFHVFPGLPLDSTWAVTVWWMPDVMPGQPAGSDTWWAAPPSSVAFQSDGSVIVTITAFNVPADPPHPPRDFSTEGSGTLSFQAKKTFGTTPVVYTLGDGPAHVGMRGGVSGLAMAAKLLASPETAALTSQSPLWDVIVLNPDGNEYVLNYWQDLNVTENFEGADSKITVPSTEVALQHITELMSDILLYRNHRLVHRHRVITLDDALDRQSHTVGIQAVSYENLLKKRVLHNVYATTGDQHDMAWDQIRITQARQNLGLTRASTARSGRPRRKVTLEHGKTVYDAIQELAQVENGFDWWVDASRAVHFQTPRRLLSHGFEWRWGRQVGEITINSTMADYTSSLYVTGSTSETSIPQGKGKPDKKYPPPVPVYLEVNPRPWGRWETTFDLSDVVTQTSLIMQGRRELAKESVPRPSYNITLDPVVWDPAIRPGSTFYLRAESPPRLNFRVLVRVEELSLSMSPDGAEDVTMSVQAEVAPTRIDMPPTPTFGDPDVSPVDADVYGDILPQMPYGSYEWGVTNTRSSVSAVDNLARVIAGVSAEAARASRGTVGDEDPVASANALDDMVTIFYTFDGEVYRAGAWNPMWPGPWVVSLIGPSAVPPPSVTDPSEIPGVVTTASLTSLGVGTVNRITPITDSNPPSFFGTKMQYSGSDLISPPLGVVFDLVTGGTTRRYSATVIAGNEAVYPGMSAAIYFNNDGVWAGVPTGPVTVGSGDYLLFSLSTTTGTVRTDPEKAPDHATEVTLNELHVDSYQLTIQSPLIAATTTAGPLSDLVITLPEDSFDTTYVGITLPPLPTGTSVVYLSLFDSNGIQLGTFTSTVTLA